MHWEDVNKSIKSADIFNNVFLLWCMQLIKNVLRTFIRLLACKIFMKLVAVFLRSKFEWRAIFRKLRHLLENCRYAIKFGNYNGRLNQISSSTAPFINCMRHMWSLTYKQGLSIFLIIILKMWMTLDLNQAECHANIETVVCRNRL